MAYQELETEKYLRRQMKANHKLWRRARNQKAIRDFVTFLFGAAMIGITFQFMASAPKWMPEVNELIARWV